MQGTLDIMVQRTGSLGRGNVLFVQNNFYYDAFFLKAIGACLLSGVSMFLKFKRAVVLNGACGNGWCYGPNGTERYHVRVLFRAAELD
jgi:integrin alpha FG-GAP repeat containing protein 1